MLSRSRARTFLEQALERGADNNAYEVRAYQITAATKTVGELLAGRHAVLTLPTGTGKTVICGMAAALFLAERPDLRALFTAPRRTLLSQLHSRSRWLSPTFPAVAVGTDPREDDRHVRAAFNYGRLIFGMPEFLGNRLSHGVLADELIAQLRLLIIDEFDHFLTLRYRARDVAVTFHDALESLLSRLPDTCRLLLVSATTPEAPQANGKPTSDGADVEAALDATARVAFRRFLDKRLTPAYVTIAPRFYADFIPHAQIIAVAVEDAFVQELDLAISEEIGLMINWISGAVGFHIDPVYVLPRLALILDRKLALAPGGRRGVPDAVAGLLGRLQWLIHLPDFVYEDMAQDVGWFWEETFRYGDDLVRRYPVDIRRIDDPPENHEGVKAMFPAFRSKAATVSAILARHRGNRGVLFFRNVRILEDMAAHLRAKGHDLVIVHGAQSTTENDRSLDRFRTGQKLLLLITRDTGKRGLDLPEADFAIFYSPKSRDDVTWQEVSRIRSTLENRKNTYILFYDRTGEAAKMERMMAALRETTHSKDIRTVAAATLCESLAAYDYGER